MKWISIEERKPPNSLYVLVAVFNDMPKVKMYCVMIGHRLDDQWFEPNHDDPLLAKGEFVTHWMPLPDVPVKYLSD